MKRLALAASALLSACPHPADRGPTAADTAGIGVDLSDQKTRVTAPGYQLTFGADGTVRLPDELLILGDLPHSNVLGTDNCPRESKMGVAMHPGMYAIGGQPLSGGSSNSFVELSGPGVARVRVDYSVPYMCPDAQHLKGESTFTMFPDGRIVRRDTVTSSDTQLRQNSSCGCSGEAAPDYFLTSFYAFTNTAKIVDAGDMPTQQTDLFDACAQWSDLTIGMRWLDAVYTTISPNAAPSFVLHIDQTSGPTFGPTGGTHSSMLKIASANPAPACGDVLATIDQPPIMVGNHAVGAGADGIYIDGSDHASMFTISATKAVPPFALSMKLGDHAKITSSVHPDNGWYVVQPVTDTGTTILWFGEGLASGETITIEPL